TALTAAGWFYKWPNKGGRWFEGRGSSNHYVPIWGKASTVTAVTELTPEDADPDQSTMTSVTPNYDTGGIKGDKRGSSTLSPVSYESSYENPSIESRNANPVMPRSGERAPAGAYSFDEMFQSVYDAGQRPKPPQEAVVWSLDD